MEEQLIEKVMQEVMKRVGSGSATENQVGIGLGSIKIVEFDSSQFVVSMCAAVAGSVHGAAPDAPIVAHIILRGIKWIAVKSVWLLPSESITKMDSPE